MNRVLLLVGLLLLAPTVTRAETLPVRGKIDSRIRSTAYHPDQVYRLYGFVGYAIELIFEAGERFVGTGGGDLEGITLDAHENSVLLKPKAARLATNLVIFTNRRGYRFDYSVSAERPDRFVDELMYAVRFTYPPKVAEEGGGETVEVRIDRELSTPAARPRNTDYWYCGKPSLRPVAAFDDGVQTRITFPDRAEIPALFVRHEDGTESLLNFSMEAGTVVVHRLAPKLILRRGKLTGCIVNKGFSGSGVRLNTGTVSPAIERAVKEPHP